MSAHTKSELHDQLNKSIQLWRRTSGAAGTQPHRKLTAEISDQWPRNKTMKNTQDSNAASGSLDRLVKPLGRFKISHALLRDNWRDVLPALSRVLVVRAESRYDLDCIEYVGFSDDFAPLEEGAEAPLYEARLTKYEDGTVTAKWERSNMGEERRRE